MNSKWKKHRDNKQDPLQAGLKLSTTWHPRTRTHLREYKIHQLPTFKSSMCTVIDAMTLEITFDTTQMQNLSTIPEDVA